MARKRTKPWKDAQGRWRSPAGHFTKKPAPKPRKKPAKPEPKKRKGPSSPAAPSVSTPPAAPAPKPVTSWITGKPVVPPKTAKRKPTVAEAKAKVQQALDAALAGEPHPAFKSRIPERPLPRLKSKVLVDVQRAKAEHDEQIRLAEMIRKSADEARVKLATDPRYGGAGARIPEKDRKAFERAVKRQEKLANRLEKEAAEKGRELAQFAREAVAADELARARRRAVRRQQRVEEFEQLQRAPMTEWDRRRAMGDLLGRTPEQITGKYKPGQLTLSYVTSLEKALNKFKRDRQAGKSDEQAWTDKLEKLRKDLLKRGHRTPIEMADFLELAGMERHDGWVMFYRGTS